MYLFILDNASFFIAPLKPSMLVCFASPDALKTLRFLLVLGCMLLEVFLEEGELSKVRAQ